MTDIEVVAAMIGVEIVRIAGSVGFVGAAGVADRMRPGVLHAKRKTRAEAAVQRHLHRVVTVAPAAGLVVDFGEPVAELTDGSADAGSGVHGDADNLVGDAAQEEIAS